MLTKFSLLAFASSASFFASVKANPVPATEAAAGNAPIAIGYFGYACAGCYHAERVAWVPVSTSDPGYAAACTNHTTISTLTLGPQGWSPPICGTQFSVGGVDGLTLECASGTDGSGSSDITGILDASGSLYETCTAVTDERYACGDPVATSGEGVQLLYLCQ